MQIEQRNLDAVREIDRIVGRWRENAMEHEADHVVLVGHGDDGAAIVADAGINANPHRQRRIAWHRAKLGTDATIPCRQVDE